MATRLQEEIIASMVTRLQSYLSGPGFRHFGSRNTGRNPTMMSYFGWRPGNPPFTMTGAESMNRNEWASTPMTTDQMVLAEKTKRSKGAHEALMRGSLTQAEDDNQILQTATPDELGNLFGAPREARLQQIVQRDYNAKERGVALIPNEKQEVAYAQTLANLKHTNLANYLDPLQFQLEQDRFAETKEQNSRSYLNSQAQLDNLMKNQEWQREHQERQGTALQNRFDHALQAPLERKVLCLIHTFFDFEDTP